MKRPDKILANDLLELEVLDLGAGTIIGSIVDFALTRDGKVSLIGILSQQWYSGGQGVAPNAITNVNNQRVTIGSADTLSEFNPDGEEQFAANTDSFILNKTVMLDDGEMLGTLQDFCFGMEDGQVTDLIVLDDEQKRVKVPVESFQTIGRDYIVIIRGAQSFDTPAEAPEVTQPEPSPEPAPDPKPEPIPEPEPVVEPVPEPVVEKIAEEETVDVGIPPAPEPEKEPPPPPKVEPTREEEKSALFGDGVEKAKLSKFDQKKRDFLIGKEAHRDIQDPDGNHIIGQGETFDDAILERMIAAGILGDVFIELTLKK